MASPVIASSATFEDASAQTSRTINKPSGTVSGDWLLLAVAIDLTATINTPTGFTEVFAADDAAATSNMKLFKRKADGTEGATFTITTTSEIGVGCIMRITGADSTDCIDVLSSWQGTLSAGNVFLPCPQAYAESDDSVIVCIATLDGGTSTFTQPSGTTNVANDLGTSSSGAAMSVAYINQASAGYTSTLSFIPSATTEDGVGVTVVIRSNTTTSYPAQAVIRCGTYYQPNATNALTYLKPYGTVDDDLLLLIQSSDISATLTPPGTFTSVQNSNNGTSIYHQVYYRVASSEGSSYTGSNTTSAAKLGSLVRVVNYDTAAPINTSSVATGSSAAPGASTITPSVNNCLLVFTAGIDNNVVQYGTGTPSGYTNVFSTDTSVGLDVSTIIALKEQTTAAATGTVSGSTSGAELWVAINIAIAPVPVIGGSTFIPTIIIF